MKKLLILLSVLAALGLGLSVSLVSCGEDGGCPGIVCNDCASDDCDVDCIGDQVEYCGHFGYFDDPGLRCAFCESADFEF